MSYSSEAKLECINRSANSTLVGGNLDLSPHAARNPVASLQRLWLIEVPRRKQTFLSVRIASRENEWSQRSYNDEQTHEALLGDITRILIENPIVSSRTTTLLKFQLSSLGMKGCDNHCHPNQPRVRHASSANSTQISAKSIFIHAAHSRQFYKISTKVLQKLCRRVYDGSGLTELDESYEKFLHFYVRSKGLKHCPDKALLLYNWTSWLSTCAFKWSDSV